MKILDALKLLWRSMLTMHEAKTTFFHGYQKLITEKRYDRLFRACYGQGVELLFFDSEKELLWLKKDGVTAIADAYYSVYVEVLVNKVYALPPQVKGNFCVFDAGMNRGYASLFFANHPSCTGVFGFELDRSTYSKALQNFALNEGISAKITPYNFGLWKDDGELDISTNGKDGHTGITATVNVVRQEQKSATFKAAVKKSSDVFAPLLSEERRGEAKVLKIDIEGAEYAVFEDLYRHRLLQQFDVIIGEAHNGLAGLEKYLDDFVCLYKNYSGRLITFCYINKKIAA